MRRESIILLALLVASCAPAAPDEPDVDTLTREAVEAYYRGFDTKDLSIIPLSEDATFNGPLLPEPVAGRSNVVAFLERVLEALERESMTKQIQWLIVDGERSCAMYEHRAGPGVDCFRVVGGEIAEIQLYFDPRPMLGDSGADSR